MSPLLFVKSITSRQYCNIWLQLNTQKSSLPQSLKTTQDIGYLIKNEKFVLGELLVRKQWVHPATLSEPNPCSVAYGHRQLHQCHFSVIFWEECQKHPSTVRIHCAVKTLFITTDRSSSVVSHRHGGFSPNSSPVFQAAGRSLARFDSSCSA